MKICLITTTIYVPRVLELYRSLAANIKFIVAGDLKTPEDEVRNFLKKIGNAQYLSVDVQKAQNTRISELIGWNKIMRRNLALLEAIRCGADIIITIDDDNIPIDDNYFSDFERLLSQPFNGIKVSTSQRWFDVGTLLTPHYPHRGYPYSKRLNNVEVDAAPAVNEKIGVAAGLWYGDPDIDAMTRISQKPNILSYSTLIENGLCVGKNTWTVFNSQNTAFLKELAPLMLVHTGVGRYDDIWASYITQRVMRTTGHLVHFGKPFVWQQRNEQNLWRNLKDEMYGMEHTDRFIADLEDIDLNNGTVIEKLRKIYDVLSMKEYVSEEVYKIGLAWCDDFEDLMA